MLFGTRLNIVNGELNYLDMHIDINTKQLIVDGFQVLFFTYKIKITLEGEVIDCRDDSVIFKTSENTINLNAIFQIIKNKYSKK